jgi:hypothetical protein
MTTQKSFNLKLTRAQAQAVAYMDMHTVHNDGRLSKALSEVGAMLIGRDAQLVEDVLEYGDPPASKPVTDEQPSCYLLPAAPVPGVAPAPESRAAKRTRAVQLEDGDFGNEPGTRELIRDLRKAAKAEDRTAAIVADLIEQLAKAHKLIDDQEQAIDRLHARILGQTIQ